MGNAIITGAAAGVGGGGGRKAKIMKMNGEFFKLSTPATARDVIENYPSHVLLDSNDFLRLNLRARPLDPEYELQPKKIYLLVELPRFPTAEEEEAENSLRRTKSSEIHHENGFRRPENIRMSRRSVSALLPTRSVAGDGAEQGPSAAVRVKVKLPKAQVEKILEQSRDDVEAAEKIIDLCVDQDAGDRAADQEAEEGDSEVAPGAAVVVGEGESDRNGRQTESGDDETTGEMSFSKCPVNFQSIRGGPYCSNYHFKYKKLIDN